MSAFGGNIVWPRRNVRFCRLPNLLWRTTRPCDILCVVQSFIGGLPTKAARLTWTMIDLIGVDA